MIRMSRGTALRLVFAGSLLSGLTMLQVLAPTAFVLFVAIALIALPVLQWSAVAFFTMASSRDPNVRSLRARSQDATSLALASTAGAVLGLIVVLRATGAIGPVPRETFLIGLAFSLIMIAAPSINWLLIWRPWQRG